MRMVIKLALVIIVGHHCYQLHTKISSSVFLRQLSPYIDETIGYHYCGFRLNRSAEDHMLCICQILEEKFEYNQTVHQLFIDFKKAYDSVRVEVFYCVLIEWEVPMKLVRMFKICLHEMYSKVHIGIHLSNNLPHQNALKQRDALILLLFNFALEYPIRKVRESKLRLKLNRTHQLLVYADDVNVLGDNIDTMNKNTDFYMKLVRKLV
jgi:hypothetical protein